MASHNVETWLSADFNQSRGCKEYGQQQGIEIQAEIGEVQIDQIRSLEKNHRNKLLQQREISQEEKASREGQLQQLEKQEQVIAEFQQTNHSLQRQMEQLQQQQAEEVPRPSQLQPPIKGDSMGVHSYWSYNKVHPWKMRMKWRDGGKAPFRMSRGAAAVNENVAYFLNWSGDLCSYNSSSKQWHKLSRCPYHYASLAVINGQLTTIGGCTDFCNKKSHTDKLLSLYYKNWAEVFPPMPTKRRDTSAVTSKEHLVVTGGMCGPFINASITTVEVMDMNTLVWSTVASLPHPYTGASGAICGDQLYILGGSSDKGELKSVLTCSLTELLQSSSSSIWHRVADAPAYNATCATVTAELLAIGGCDEKDQATAAIHKYNLISDSWDLISNMPTARCNCLTAILPVSEMMVIGGDVRWNCTLANVEISSF